MTIDELLDELESLREQLLTTEPPIDKVEVLLSQTYRAVCRLQAHLIELQEVLDIE